MHACVKCKGSTIYASYLLQIYIYNVTHADGYYKSCDFRVSLLVRFVVYYNTTHRKYRWQVMLLFPTT